MAARSKSRPRTKSPETRREELMNAAQRLFLSRGVSRVTIEQITDAAQVAKGTFYLYFSSKEDILAALANRFGESLLRRVKEAVAAEREGDWTGKLAAWITGCAEGYLDAIQLHDILFYGSRSKTRERLVDNIVIDDLEGLLGKGVAARAWALDDPRFTAVFLFSALHAVVDDAYSREKRVNRARLLERVERFFFRAVNLDASEASPRVARVSRGC